jgi:hypothetical protein
MKIVTRHCDIRPKTQKLQLSTEGKAFALFNLLLSSSATAMVILEHYSDLFSHRRCKVVREHESKIIDTGRLNMNRFMIAKNGSNPNPG